MLVEEREARILIDPGVWSSGQGELKDLDAILITHEHQDHLDPKCIKVIMQNNPAVKIYTNQGVGKILSENSILCQFLKNGQAINIRGVIIEAFGEKHATIHPEFPIVDDTGYMIAEKFFYPGDAFHIPDKPVNILALPVVAPWMKSSEAIDYALRINPKVAIPVHDGFLKFAGPFYSLPEAMLSKSGIEFRILEEGKTYDFV